MNIFKSSSGSGLKGERPDILGNSDVDPWLGSLGLVTLILPEKSARKSGDGDTLKRRLLGAAVLIALAVIFLPLLLDGSGSESRFRRVEQLRTQPPRIIGVDGVVENPAPVRPAKPSVDEEPLPAPSVKSEIGESSFRTDSAVTAPASQSAAQKSPQAANKSTTVVAGPTVTVNQPPLNQASLNPASPSQAPQATTLSPKTGQIEELVAWIVQAGSFADEQNALALRDSLRQQGFPTFVTLADSGQTVVYRVKVGPMTDLLKAESSQQQIELITGRKTLVRRYP